MHRLANRTKLQKIALSTPPVIIVALAAILLLLYQHRFKSLQSKTFATGLRLVEERTLSHFNSVFSPVSGALVIVSGWLNQQTPNIHDTTTLNSQFMPVLREMPQVSSALVASSTGREYMLMQTPAGWLTRLTDPKSNNGKSRWTRWDKQGKATEKWQEALNYDPRNRPWFRGAADAGSSPAVFWTEPYRFLTTKSPGITAAMRSSPSDSSPAITTAFDVRLGDLSSFSIGISNNTRTCAFAMTQDGSILARPTTQHTPSSTTMQDTLLTPASESPTPIIRNTWQAWSKQNRAKGTPFRFTSATERWWGNVADYQLGNQRLLIAVAIPEEILREKLGVTTKLIPLGIISAGLLLSLGWILFVLKRNQNSSDGQAHHGPLADLDLDDPNKLDSQVAALISQGESDHLEFKASVRWNFNAGRTGKEMELAWLKTVVAYINSSGGAILLGVSDDGQALGLGHDGFANDDKALRHIDNLIAQHIGAAHAPSITLRIVTIAGQKVILIICRPSQEPAFLKNNKGEDFYIRTGPASRALSSSEAMAYVDARRHLNK